MKLLYPPDKTRHEITARLRQFFKTEEVEFFNAALNLFCEFYEITKPTVEWYQRLDDTKVGGLTYANGKIELLAPEFWKQNKKHKSFKRWAEIFFHECYHFMFWVSDEDKADEFAERWLKK